MALNMNVLLTDIKSDYVFLKENSYPDYLLSSPRCGKFGKNNLHATEFKDQGNAAFWCRDDEKAILYYTKSIQSAIDKSEELALAYANRSAALFRLGKFEQCLLDINRALKGEYPEHLRNKLHDRKKKCLLEIVRLGVNIVGEETDPVDSSATGNRSTVPKGNFDNPLLPNTSSKIKLACDKKWGRYMVATKDIEPGEILSCEQFFVTFLYSELQWTHCSYCSVRCTALIPCPSCSQMMYCSKNCLTRAYNAYHRTECKMMPFFTEDEDTTEKISPLVVVLRLLFVGTEQGTKIEEFLSRMSPQDIFEENVNPVNKPFVGDYRSILQLRRKFEHPSNVSILAAVKAIVWLQRCSFFKNRPNPNVMSETELFATLALLNHMQSAYKHHFSEITIPARSLQCRMSAGQKMHVGHGIAALHNLVNHSCDSNVVYIGTRERELIIFSVRPIKRGEQIFVGYCPSYLERTLAQRKKLLSPFEFTCCCEACTNDWPLYASLFIEEPKYITNDTEIIAKLQEMYARTVQLSVQDTNIQDLIRSRKLIHDYVRSPSLLANMCEDKITLYMIRMYSNLCYENDNVKWMEERLDKAEEQTFALFKNLST